MPLSETWLRALRFCVNIGPFVFPCIEITAQHAESASHGDAWVLARSKGIITFRQERFVAEERLIDNRIRNRRYKHESPLSLNKTFLPERSLNNIVVLQTRCPDGTFYGDNGTVSTKERDRRFGCTQRCMHALTIISHRKCKSLRDPSCLGMTGKKDGTF